MEVKTVWIKIWTFLLLLDFVTSAQNETAATTTEVPPRPTVSTKPQGRTTPITLTPQTPTNYLPTVLITVRFTMPWPKFCPLSEMFRKEFATHLIEQGEDKTIHLVSAVRIRFVNVEGHCKGIKTSNGGEKAELEFYVSKKNDLNNLDEAMTIKAYRILDSYLVNKKMSKIHALFSNKVEFIGISGSKTATRRKGIFLTEFDKIGIGAGAVLAVILVTALIQRHRKNSNKRLTSRDPEQTINPSKHELAELKSTEGNMASFDADEHDNNQDPTEQNVLLTVDDKRV